MSESDQTVNNQVENIEMIRSIEEIVADRTGSNERTDNSHRIENTEREEEEEDTS